MNNICILASQKSTIMTPFTAELLGTCFIIIIGQGVVANVLLPKTKGNGSGLMAITIAWAIAVFLGVSCTAAVSGAHLNPAITIALAILGKFNWNLVPGYLLAQLLGAMIGALVVYIMYGKHYNEAENPNEILATFSTSAAIKSTFHSLFGEAVGTFILVMGVLLMTKSANSLGALDALPVALLVLGIGLGLGGTTGYAINPARDLGPRIMHAILPIKNKGGSNWGYSWIPVVGPFVGAVLAALVFKVL